MRRVLRHVVPVVVAGLVAGCGVRSTGVIGAGEPAVAQEGVPQTTVYLVRNGQLVPVRRVAFPGAPQAALYDLWRRGATSQEAQAGMRAPLLETPLYSIAFREGVLIVNRDRDYRPSRLVTAEIVCSGTAQPNVRRVRLVGWRREGPGPEQPGDDYRHPARGWVAVVGVKKKCSDYDDLMAP
jgi:hypothetical protein